MNPDTDDKRASRPSADEAAMEDLLNETRVLRRRVNFWQRFAWLLLGAVVIVGTVIWQRGELRRRECAQSLHILADLAIQQKLGQQHRDIMEQQWQSLGQGRTKLAPMHYDLIVENWQLDPKPGELLPLAVCRETHFLAFSRGRNILFRDDKGIHIEWRSEEASETITQQAARDNRPH